MIKMNAEERKQNMNAGSDDILSPTDSKTGVKWILAETVKGFIYAFFGYLLGLCRLPFGATPFGIALLSASDRKVPYILAGVCISALFDDRAVVLICAYIAVFFIRILVRLSLDPPWKEGDESGEWTIREIFPVMFSENVCLRMATSSVGAFIIGIYTLIGGGFLFYDLYGAIIAMAAAPLAVILTHGIFNRSGVITKFSYFSAALLIFGVVYSANEIGFYGVSVSVFIAMFATLFVSRRGGMVFGMATGLVCGLAYSPIYAPVFVFGAFAACALWRVSVMFASVSAFVVGMAWAIYVNGVGAISALMPALLSAALIFGVIDRVFFSETVEIIEKPKEQEVACERTKCQVSANMLSEVRLDAAHQKIKELCGRLSEMSEFFDDLGGKMRKPLASDVKNICDDAFDACCGNCKHREYCWEENHAETIAAIATASARIHREGKLLVEDMPRSIRDICERLPDIVDETNHNYTAHSNHLLFCDKTEIFALDYGAMSDLLAGSMTEEGSKFQYDPDLSKAICEGMVANSLGVRAVVAYGDTKKHVIVEGESAELLRREEEKLTRVLEDISGIPLNCVEIRERDTGGAIALFSAKRKFAAQVAKRCIMSEGEVEFCGDTVKIFENDNDKFYTLISDGMGSGRDAALTSGICAMFIQKMMSVANKCEVALRMLNGFLRNKGGGSIHECSATVDLMELDLVEGKASFYKSGAAPTYVLREGNLFKLRSKTVPLGIIKEVDLKKISFNTGEGDLIVMVSDGVTKGKDECPWLFDLLKKNAEKESTERLAEMIALRAGKESRNDDISVAVIKIKRLE